MLALAQEPCVPAAACFYDLVRERLGLWLADAAAPFGSAELVEQVLSHAGFASIQVHSWCFQHLLQHPVTVTSIALHARLQCVHLRLVEIYCIGDVGCDTSVKCCYGSAENFVGMCVYPPVFHLVCIPMSCSHRRLVSLGCFPCRNCCRWTQQESTSCTEAAMPRDMHRRHGSR